MTLCCSKTSKVMEEKWFGLFTLFLTIILLKLLRAGKGKLPPGPRKLPIIGNLHQLATTAALPHHRLAELARVHGPIMHLRLGESSTVIISSADMAREVLKTHDAVLCSRPSILLGETVFYGRTDIAFAPYGEHWRQVRKISALELFTPKRVLSFRPVREEEVRNLVRSLASEAWSVVNLSKKLFGLAFDITSRLAFSKKGKEQEQFRKLLADISDVGSGFSIGDLYPSIKYLHSITGMKRKLQDLVTRSDKILDPIIDDHISSKKQGKTEEDLVDVLLKFHEDDLYHDDTHFSLTIQNIKAIVLDLFGAGSETASTTVEWAISELLKNPRVMQKAQEEVRQELQGVIEVDETNIEELKYLKLVIKETLRLHPPIPLLLPRESMERCKLNSYEIPPKTRVFINAWAIARDPKYWDDPEMFIPERFQDSSVDYRGNNFELIPFGAGRRICPGIGLGIANLQLTLAMLLYHFDWKLPNHFQAKDLDMDETFGIVSRRKNDLLVIPTIYAFSSFN
uniref:Cytochrome P450 71D443-like protein n=1 Tax=Sesuvium portulacastrum TaxID=221166 RepID=A0A3S8X7N6_SESPO|nr:cytochrome P450 71D443-like protein [Sesuvium portulacastrum]